MACRLALALLMLAAAAACSGVRSLPSASGGATVPAPQMDAKRKVAEQDCSKPPAAFPEGNLRCR